MAGWNKAIAKGVASKGKTAAKGAAGKASSSQFAAGARARRAEGAATKAGKKTGVPNVSRKESSTRRDFAKQGARAANLRVNPKSKSAKAGRFAASKKGGATAAGAGAVGAGGAAANRKKGK